MNAAWADREEWRWDPRRHHRPPERTIAVIEPPSDEGEKSEARRQHTVPFGFARAIAAAETAAAPPEGEAADVQEHRDGPELTPPPGGHNPTQEEPWKQQ